MNMAITQEELQAIISSVLSSIRTNSKTIDQLTPLTSLSDTDSIEIDGGKRVSYSVLKELMLSKINESLEEVEGTLESDREAIEDLDERLTAAEGILTGLAGELGELREEVEAQGQDMVLMNHEIGETKRRTGLLEGKSEVVERRVVELEGMWVRLESEEAAEAMAEAGEMEDGKIYYTVEG